MAAVKGKKAGARRAPARKAANAVSGKRRPAIPSLKKAPLRKKPAPAPSPARKTASGLKAVAKKAVKAVAKKAVKAAAKKAVKVVKKNAVKVAKKISLGKVAKALKAKVALTGKVASKKGKPAPVRKGAAKAVTMAARPAGATKGAASKLKKPGPSALKATPKGAFRLATGKGASAPAPSKEASAKPEQPATARPGKAVSTAPAARGGRRPKVKISGDGAVTAAWLINTERPRPSSFIPAPPRAESPFLVAAPPASSDRLIRPDDLKAVGSGIRTYTVRVDIEQGGGKTVFGIYPEEVSVRVGEGIEWDFRYLGGADASVDEVVIEFDKPGPFGTTSFKSKKPGSNRPHRLISGAALSSAVGKRVVYTIRALNLIKSEIARTKPSVTVNPMPIVVQNAST